MSGQVLRAFLRPARSCRCLRFIVHGRKTALKIIRTLCENSSCVFRTLCEFLLVMKNNTRTTEVSITLRHNPETAHVLSIDGPQGFKGDDIYFSENDGTRIADLSPAFIALLPEGAKVESNGRDEAWISHWDDSALAALDGRTFDIRFTQTFEVDEDGEENWIEDSATLIA